MRRSDDGDFASCSWSRKPFPDLGILTGMKLLLHLPHGLGENHEDGGGETDARSPQRLHLLGSYPDENRDEMKVRGGSRAW